MKLLKTGLLTKLSVIVLSLLFIVTISYAATTIGSNITTGGNLTVSGNASTTNATTTGYLYVGQDITEPPGWDFGIGDLIVADDAFFNSQATTSVSFWIGSSGTADNLDLASGDLYVQGDVEIDGATFLTGLLTFGSATGTSATTTGYFMIGVDGSESPNFDFSGDLWVSDTVEIGGNTTTTGTVIIGAETQTATTTLKIKSSAANGANGGSCIEMVGAEGTTYAVFVNGSGTLVAVSGTCD